MSDHPLHVVVLAAGKGKRMRSDLPKVLHPVAGKPLLGHVLDIVAELNPAKTHVVIGHGADLVRERLAKWEPLDWVIQEEQLGTGHAVQMAIPDIPDDARVLVLLGDSPLMTAASLQRVLDLAADGLAVLTARVVEPAGYGRIVRDESGHLKQIVEHKDADPATLAINEVNSGVVAAGCADLRQWLDRVDRKNAQGEFYLTDCVAIARGDGRTVSAALADEAEEILGANDRWQLSELERLFQRRVARGLCEQGATLMDPSRVDVRGSLSVSDEVVIDINTVFEGDNQLGAGVSIGPNCVLINCSLGPGTRVHPSCVLEGVVTRGECDIGPFARLRPGTELAEHTKVGNFVETKKARLGEGSKASHLSYLGDAEIGASVNIGAGTITCNYDGANKFKTVIEDGVFVGSDTQLVAPVTVEKGATIGAGSTITKTAPRDALTLSRAKQITITGWKKPTKKG
ncbi:MAG: bifunctional UDP-N-acetylglucosamine diphosphorylase/glucosamine-1-phosphate N-acetyltransferase GlmU [Xanthomonadales bacterium]|nr:bifunctional UDP-N-acetylglucosamine diphosphorylase/glucosamine-1-phosphate N-acetyltransferase GlmU [Xanthomonadales bacterium]